MPAVFPQNIPGFGYATETGFYAPALFSDNPSPGLADHGKRILLTFYNVPSGVHIFVPTELVLMTGLGGPVTPPQPPAPVPPGISTGLMELVHADQFGNSAPGYSSTGGIANVQGTLVAQANYAGNTAYVTYEVVNGVVGSLNLATIPVAVAFKSADITVADQPAQISVSVAEAPAGGPLAGIETADIAAPIPRFKNSFYNGTNPAFTINACGPPPTPTSVSPSSGSGASQTFAFAFSDPNGATDITSAQMDINATLAVANACYLFYARAPNALYLASNAGAWQGPVTVGGSGTLQNSQCSANASASSVTQSGNNLTLNLALTFTAGFAGAKNVYMEVRNDLHDSGWSANGTWTVGSAPPPPDFSIGMTAGPGTVAAGASPTYAVTVGSVNGFSGVVSLGVSGLPSGVTGAFVPTTVTGSATSTLTLTTAGASPSSFTITVTGTSGVLTHNTTASLTVTGSGGSPTATSVTPSSGSGLTQTLSFVYTDPNGAADITSVQMDINATLAVANACYLFYVRGTNALYLASDSGAWQGPITIGSATSLQNNQCSVSAGGSSVTPSGNTLTVNLALTFKAAFAGAKNVYMEVRNASVDSGWSSKGSWTVGSNSTPDFTIGMTSGPGTVAAGASPTYTVTVTGANGFAGVVSFGVSGLPSGVTGGFSPATVTGSGSTTLTLNTTAASSSSFTITVTGASGALHHDTTESLTITGGSGGPPAPTSVTPSSGTGLTQTFAFTFTAPNGATDITSAQMDINATLAVGGACYMLYSRAANQVYLASDAGAWHGPITLGGSGTLTNSQCTVSAAGSSATPSGTTLTVNLAITFKAAFTGAKNVYMEVQNASHDSGWTQEGTWTVGSGGQANSPPTVVSVTPSSGSGTSHTFAFAYSDPDGATDISSVQMDINSSLSIANGCYLYYVRATNALYLANDSGTFQGPLAIGSAGTLQNTQCTVNSGSSSVTAVGNTLTVNLALTFKAAFTGSKNVYTEVRDATHDAGWSLKGAWTP